MSANEEPGLEKILEIFHPWAAEKLLAAKKQTPRFAHYTSVDGALGIIRDRAFWLRKASCMSDFMEINHGRECLVEAYRGEHGMRLCKILENTFGGFIAEFEKLFNAWVPHFREDTYIGCVSEHLESEDRHGRLSMWRAFGPGAVGVALIFKGEPFLRESTGLSVYSSPVNYLRRDEFSGAFAMLVNGIERNIETVRAMGAERVLQNLFHTFRLACLCVKHRGFDEEREWRVFYAPMIEQSKYVTRSIRVIRGVPQPLFELQLRNHPDQGITGIEVPEIFDRLLIGPTQYPAAVFEAFAEELTTAGVKDAAKKIFVSDIPIRT